MRRVRDGFTIVELIITLVVMVILTGLSVVIVGNIQAQARDSERQQDAEAIARSLETRYKNGNTYTIGGNQIVKNQGGYPGNFEMFDWQNGDVGSDKVFPGASAETLRSPSGATLEFLCLAWFYVPECNDEDQKAETNNALQMIFRDGSDWTDKYVYEYVASDGKYCFDNCARYNIYWISETDKTVFKGIPGLKVLKSRHQQ